MIPLDDDDARAVNTAFAEVLNTQKQTDVFYTLDNKVFSARITYKNDNEHGHGTLDVKVEEEYTIN